MSTENEPKKKKRFRWLLLIRRIHLYAGVVLFPFIMILGVSGFLFNHTSTFWGGYSESISTPPDQSVRELTGFKGLSPEDASKAVTAALNTDGKTYKLLESESPFYTQPISFQSKNIRLQLDIENGGVTATKSSREKPVATKAPFNGVQPETPLINADEIANAVNKVFPDKQTDFKAPDSRTPELRFVVEDSQGRKWNVRYDMVKNQVSGNAADDPAPFNFSGFITKLHKSHHYPASVNSKWIWVFIADCCAIAIVVWGITGLILAWQLKKLRRLCIGLLVVSIIAAIAIAMANYKQFKLTPPRVKAGSFDIEMMYRYQQNDEHQAQILKRDI